VRIAYQDRLVCELDVLVRQLADRLSATERELKTLKQSPGVHPELSVQAADAISFRLKIPRLVLRQAAGEYERARGRAARGRVRVAVLGEFGDACLLDRVLAAGACAGCWGPVTRWAVASEGARGQVFPRRYEFLVVRPRPGAAQIALVETRTADGKQEITAHAARALA
jgi:hypothetical protein